MTRVIAINGSPRKKGNTAALIGVAFEEFKKAGFKEVIRRSETRPIMRFKVRR